MEKTRACLFEARQGLVLEQFTFHMTAISLSMLLAAVLMYHGTVERVTGAGSWVAGAVLFGASACWSVFTQRRTFGDLVALRLARGVGSAAARVQARQQMARLMLASRPESRAPRTAAGRR